MTDHRVTLKTRKPIDKLTAADLLAFPIWEYAIDEEDVEGRDETWVRPTNATVVRANSWSLSVAADFRTHSGITLPGLMGVTTAGGVEIDGAVLLPERKYIVVDSNSAASRRSTASALGMSVRDLFPLSFTLRVRI